MTALPLNEVARHLGVTDGRLRQRIASGDLLALRGPDGRSHRIPIFQLTADGELHGLPRILRAFRKGLKLVVIHGFLTTPQPDLDAPDGSPMTPIHWLAAGGDVDAVVALAKQI